MGVGGLAACASPAAVVAPAPLHEPATEDVAEVEVAADTVAVEMPVLPRDASCGQARAAYHDAWSLAGVQTADLTNGQYGSVLARHRYFDACNVPAKFEIRICAAVQNGSVQGATVRTSPRAPHYERCIDRGVRSLDFPTHARMDVTTTVFSSSN